MSAYKKTLLYTAILITSQAYGLTSTEIKQFITNKVMPPFTTIQIKNIFDQRVPQQVFDHLYAIKAHVKEFIENEGRSDTNLMKAFTNVEKANDTLINAIKISFNSFFAQKHNLDKEEQQAFQKINNNLKLIQTNMKSIVDQLDAITFWLQGKKDARDILATLAETISFIAKKAQKDLETKALPFIAK